MTKSAIEITEQVRRALRARRGRRPALLQEIRMTNPRTQITARWLQAFSDHQDREPRFTKVVELGRALGIEIRMTAEEVSQADRVDA